MSGETKPTILVVDDAPDTLEVLERSLSAAGYRVLLAGGVREALQVLDEVPVDLVLTDLRMPQESGLDLVRHVRENLPVTGVLMMTGYASIGGAVEAVRAGAEDYLAKPFTDEELLAAISVAIEKVRVRRAANLEAPAARPEGLIGESSAMQSVYRTIAMAADSTATVLITGESGTGKELVARAIHYGGPRKARSFVPVNCGAIPEGLIESELFGHVKGAFTGATDSRAGFFQTADGGTIFLDEIAEIGPATQVKLLRVLQDREVTMVGANRARAVDARILAASNKDLAALVRKGTFREDLFFRVHVLTVEVPPLRERDDDVVLLARHFALKFARELRRPAPQFADAALAAFRAYHWPGNVRELENAVQRAVVMGAREWIDVTELPAHLRFSPRPGGGLLRSLAEVEAEHLRLVLSAVDGNKTRAAEILGIDRKTLRLKLRALDLD